MKIDHLTPGSLLKENIKILKVPKILVKLKIVPEGFSFGVYSYILLDENSYRKYNSESHSAKILALIEHERTHILRQRKIGFLKFALYYFTSKEFCFQEELIAIKAEMRILKFFGKNFKKKKTAKQLNKVWFYKCADEDIALERLKALWEETLNDTT